MDCDENVPREWWECDTTYIEQLWPEESTSTQLTVRGWRVSCLHTYYCMHQMYHLLLETIIHFFNYSYTVIVILSPHHTYDDVRWRFSCTLVAPIVPVVVHLGAAKWLITQQKALHLDRTHRPQDTTTGNSVCRITHQETM